MKSIFTLLVFLSLSIATTALHAQAADPVRSANRSNEKKTDEGVVNEDVAAFLVLSADARMMGKMEGAMAAKKGTTSAIRQYGQLMIKDQTLLLNKIKALAAIKKISLPAGISNKKESGREDLADKTGKDFDKKFVKMMRIDHERDVNFFREAVNLPDKDVSAFAASQLPLIQSHLDKVIALEKTLD